MTKRLCRMMLVLLGLIVACPAESQVPAPCC